MIELLTEKDLEKIDAYRWTYSYINERPSKLSWLPAKKMLNIWEKNKSVFLKKLFNNKLILEKEISHTSPDQQLVDNMVRMLCKDQELRNILTQLKNSAAKAELNNAEAPLLSSEIYRAINEISLATNHLALQKPIKLKTINKEILVSPGMKTMKLLQKIAKEFDISGYEKLWEAQSMVTNTKKIKGTLCLSIHPLDFITMSDNDAGWKSCMSWKKPGCYRLGTVEMMNSPVVIVAYVKSEKDMNLVDYYTWNNKKWRSLFIVTPNMITNIKGYPYQSSILNDEVFSWLQELGIKQGINYTIKKNSDYNGNINCEENNSYISMVTDYMYNKDYKLTSHTAYLTKEQNLTKGRNKLNYSGAAQCMWCGTTKSDKLEDFNQYKPMFLCCSDCESSFFVCECCGNCIFSSKDIYYYDGDAIYCEDCWNDHTVEEAHYGDIIEDKNATTIEVWSDNKFMGSFWLANADLSDFAEELNIDEQEFCDFFQISIYDLNEKIWKEYHLNRYIYYTNISEDKLPDFLKKNKEGA